MSFLSKTVDPIPALKRQLAEAIILHLGDCTTEQGGLELKLARQRIGDIRKGKLDDFSLQRLVRCLYRMGASVEIVVVPPREHSVREWREEQARIKAIVVADRQRAAVLREKRRAARQRRHLR